MSILVTNFLSLLPKDKVLIVKNHKNLQVSKTSKEAFIRISINKMLRDLLYLHSSKTKDNISNVLLWITDDTSNDEWLALLSSDVIPYFNDNNIFNYLGE